MTTSSMKSNSTQDMAALLQRLQERDIRVWVEGERLRFSLPKAQESYREPLKAELSTHKVALMVFLQSQQSPMLDKAILQPVDRNQELPLSLLNSVYGSWLNLMRKVHRIMSRQG